MNKFKVSKKLWCCKSCESKKGFECATEPAFSCCLTAGLCGPLVYRIYDLEMLYQHYATTEPSLFFVDV